MEWGMKEWGMKELGMKEWRMKEWRMRIRSLCNIIDSFLTD